MSLVTVLASGGYDWSLTGWTVWLTAGMGGGLAILLVPGIRLPQRAKAFLQTIAPIVMLCCQWFICWLDNGTSPFSFSRKSYYAQLDVAYIVAWAFGLAFCVEAFRSSQKAALVSGIVATSIYLGLAPQMFSHVHHWNG